MRSPSLYRALVAVIVCGPTFGFAHDQNASASRAKYQGPSADYAFPLPEPGSYILPAIERAAGGRVLDEAGRGRDLADIVRGRITVLAFIYTRCGDICPTASLYLSLLRDLLGAEPALSGKVRLASMSFDPEHDTPAVMAEHAGHWRANEPGHPEWVFLTASDKETLAPILIAYDQPVGSKADRDSPTGPLHHVFRAFLIDETGTIRNIYSLDFLDPKLVLTDIRTLLLEDDKRSAAAD